MKNALIGVISDTHGLLRDSALHALAGCSHIIHAGDVGKHQVLLDLERIAPVSAVRGNTDMGDWAAQLPRTAAVEMGEHFAYVIHDLAQLDLEPRAAGMAAVIFGHSHRPHVATKRGVLFLNPGSAGPRRFDLPVTLMLLEICGQHLHPRIVELDE